MLGIIECFYDSAFIFEEVQQCKKSVLGSQVSQRIPSLKFCLCFSVTADFHSVNDNVNEIYSVYSHQICVTLHTDTTERNLSLVCIKWRLCLRWFNLIRERRPEWKIQTHPVITEGVVSLIWWDEDSAKMIKTIKALTIMWEHFCHLLLSYREWSSHPHPHWLNCVKSNLLTRTFETLMQICLTDRYWWIWLFTYFILKSLMTGRIIIIPNP